MGNSCPLSWSFVLIVFCLFVIFISRFGFKSGICFLIAPVPVHCFSITFIGIKIQHQYLCLWSLCLLLYVLPTQNKSCLVLSCVDLCITILLRCLPEISTAPLGFMTTALRFTTVELRMFTMRPIFATVLVWYKPVSATTSS